MWKYTARQSNLHNWSDLAWRLCSIGSAFDNSAKIEILASLPSTEACGLPLALRIRRQISRAHEGPQQMSGTSFHFQKEQFGFIETVKGFLPQAPYKNSRPICAVLLTKYGVRQ